ncbi:MAG: sporulation protein YunB [Ruminococcus sp.]|nr:sporulation protein YunB [Ruminococcus sp.]
MRRYYTHKANFITGTMSVICFILAMLLGIDITAAPVIKSLARAECSRFCSAVVNSAVIEAIGNSDVTPSDIVEIKYNNSGGISSVETNTADISMLQAEIALAVNETLGASKGEISIPVGTFTGLSFLNGKGFPLDFDILSTGYSSVSVASVFTSAGINQTRHEIIITVNAETTAVIPLFTENYTISERYVICDTIVVGEIPESYTYICGDDRDDISKLNDYKPSEY